MASSDHDQPLLGSPKSSTPICKAFCLTLSLVTILSLASLVTFRFTTNNHFGVCATAGRPTSCLALLSKEVVGSAGVLPLTRLELLRILLRRSAADVAAASRAALQVDRRINDRRLRLALSDCVELMGLSLDQLHESSMALVADHVKLHPDVHSWLSAVLTNHVTCLDGLHGDARSAMESDIDHLIDLASATLAVVASIAPPTVPLTIKESNIEEYPPWLSSKDRRLLEATASEIKANVVVAKDGSGKYKKVQEAVDSAPDNGKARYVIYVKKGVYKEQVDISKMKKNVMLVGDGMDSTVITGSLNAVDGSSTFRSATVGAVGEGFIAQDIGFQNAAGPEKHQAVALRVGSDKSVINRCKIDAYQDTLYTHSLRQFFRDTTVIGTVDFIFGNAAVVFQNCTIVATKPTADQNNMVTAQGRTDPNQNTAISVQKCRVVPSGELARVKGSIKTYLGRPWKEYSRTVFMQSYIDDHVDPKGWSEWSGSFALKTLYYGEYANDGPGAGTGKRVNWPGYHVITEASEATKFTVRDLIQGESWLKSTGVDYTAGLS